MIFLGYKIHIMIVTYIKYILCQKSNWPEQHTSEDFKCCNMPSKKKNSPKMGSSRKNKVKTAHCFISMASIILSVVHHNAVSVQ